MRAHSFTLSVAAVVGAFALFATPAEAGGRKHHRYHNNNCYHGGGYGYYQPYYRGYYRPVRYVRYVPAPVVYYPRPVFQIGFAFGGNGYCR